MPAGYGPPPLIEISCSLFVLRAWRVRNHFKHSIELVDREGDIVDVLAAVEDFLPAQARTRLRNSDGQRSVFG